MSMVDLVEEFSKFHTVKFSRSYSESKTVFCTGMDCHQCKVMELCVAEPSSYSPLVTEEEVKILKQRCPELFV